MYPDGVFDSHRQMPGETYCCEISMQLTLVRSSSIVLRAHSVAMFVFALFACELRLFATDGVLCDERNTISAPVAPAYQMPKDDGFFRSNDLFFDRDLSKEQRAGFIERCNIDGVAVGFHTEVGLTVWHAFGQDWGRAHRIARQLKIDTLTPPAGMPVLASICPEARSPFLEGDWNSAFRAAVQKLTEDVTALEIVAIRHTLDECHRRSIRPISEFRLPSAEEWKLQKHSMSRKEQIVFLGERICLDEGVLNRNGVLIPTGILALENHVKTQGQVKDMSAEGEMKNISPFEELLLLNITSDEIELLFPFLSFNWTLRPACGTQDAQSLKLNSGSRYSLCMIINRSVGVKNAIREYDLELDKWEDVAEIRRVLAERMQRK